MKFRLTLAALLPLATLAFAALPAHAADPISVILTPEGGASVVPGNTLIYDASFTNATGSDYTLDNASFDAGDPQTQGLFSPLFTGPYTVGQGVTSYTDVFELTTDPSLPVGTPISGDITFDGSPLSGGLPVGPVGPDADVASAGVQFQVTPAVPEPSSLAALALGLLTVGFLVISTRKKTTCA